MKVGKNVNVIGKQAFANCTKLKSVTIGSNVNSIGDKAFYKCTSLQKITLPSTVKKIGTQAFYGDKKLTQMIVKGTAISSVEKKSFTGIPANAKVNVPNSMIKKYKKMFQTAGLNKKAKVY